MLVDKLKEFIKHEPHKVAWVGFDEKKSGDQRNANEKLRDLFSDVVLFDLIPLQDTLQETFGDQPFRFVRDCFAPIPPYPKSGLEFHNGPRSLTLLETIKIGDVTDMTPHVDRYCLRDEALKRPGQNKPFVRVVDETDRVPLTDAAFFITASLLIHLQDDETDREHMVFFDTYAGYYASRQGELLTQPIVNPDLNNPDLLEGPMFSELLELAMKYFNFTAMAQNLMACKNVTHVARKIDKKLQRARHRREKEPLSEYRVLVIEAPPTLRKNLSANPNHTEIERRLHKVPAGIRDYTERGLFGKWKGRFFFSAHERGNPNLGTIKKQYTVVPPREREEQTNGSEDRH